MWEKNFTWKTKIRIYEKIFVRLQKYILLWIRNMCKNVGLGNPSADEEFVCQVDGFYNLVAFEAFSSGLEMMLSNEENR